MVSYSKIFFVFLFLSGISTAQNSISFYYENGIIKYLNQNELPSVENYKQTSNQKQQKADRYFDNSPFISSSKFKLLFERDSADAFYPGLEVYNRVKSSEAMIIGGTNQKAIVMSVLDTASGKVSTYNYSPSTFQALQTVVDTGYKRVKIGIETANIQLTGGPELEHAIFYGTAGGGSVPPSGTTQTQVRAGISGDLLFRGVIDNRGIGGYYYAWGHTDETKTDFDLTGNGLYEVIGLKSPGFFSTEEYKYRLYIFDNFTIIDSIDELRSSFFNNLFTTTLDINSDGKPEVVSAINQAPDFYQWNPSAKKFQLIGSLGQLQSMLTKPDNVDADAENEIIGQAGLLGDSIIIYSSSFNKKTVLKVPGMPVRYFVENLNNSANKEIVVVTNIDLTYGLKATLVYDLSVGTDPIWFDSTFDCQAIGDFHKTGHNELLGVKLDNSYKDFTKRIAGLPKGNLRLINPGNNFQPIWTRTDTNITYTNNSTLAGPFAPSNYMKLNQFASNFQQFLLAQADFDGDGVNDFITFVRDKSYSSTYLIVNMNGELLDTLMTFPSVIGQYPPTVLALSHDFNGNGLSEILVTTIPSILMENDVKNAYLFEYGSATDVDKEIGSPASFSLSNNYPNPFNPTTRIKYNLPVASNIRLSVYNLLGEVVHEIVNNAQTAGSYEINFNASGLSSGVYFYSIEADPLDGSKSFKEVKKMLLLK